MEYVNAVISFSTDVNSVELSKKPLKNWFLQRKASRWNRRHMIDELSKIALNCGIEGMTISKGTELYVSQKGERFMESSVQVDLVFTTGYAAEHMASQIASIFKQEAVLVRYVDYSDVKQYNQDGEVIQS